MASDEPLYTTRASVKVRLVNKVQFQANANEVLEGELPDDLLLQLIKDAETEVEQDLRGRYDIPFRSKTTNTFSQLPDHTRRAIRMVVDMKAVMMVLNFDFGRGTHIDGSSYYDSISKAYDAQITKLLGQDQEGKLRDRFRFTPPLEDLKLAPGNTEADHGHKGKIVIVGARNETRLGDGGFAEDQINDPGLVNLGMRGVW